MDAVLGRLCAVAGSCTDAVAIEGAPIAMKFPKRVFVYVEVPDSGDPFLVAVRDIEEIPEEIDHEMVATYKLRRREQFIVRRILK